MAAVLAQKPGRGAGGGVAQVYERLPFVLGSALTTTAATDTFSESDLTNYTGYDFELWEVCFDVSGNFDHRNWSVRITDTSRNFQWMRPLVRVSVLVQQMQQSANRPGGNSWRLAKPCIIRNKASMRVDMSQTNTDSKTYDVAFKGYLLVPLPEGDYRQELILRSMHALP